MALFKRKQNPAAPPMPPEVETYYQSEKRERAWMAWLLAIVTLIVTVLVAGGLFLGGRWAYHKLRSQPKPVKVSVQEEPKTKTPTTPATAPTSQPAPATSPKPATTPQTSSTSTLTTPTTPANSSLPNTGPGENMLAIFALTSLAGVVFHKRILKPLAR